MASKVAQILAVLRGQHVMGDTPGNRLKEYHDAVSARNAKAYSMDTTKGLRLCRQALKNYRVDVMLCEDFRSFCIVRHDNSAKVII